MNALNGPILRPISTLHLFHLISLMVNFKSHQCLLNLHLYKFGHLQLILPAVAGCQLPSLIRHRTNFAFPAWSLLEALSKYCFPVLDLDSFKLAWICDRIFMSLLWCETLVPFSKSPTNFKISIPLQSWITCIKFWYDTLLCFNNYVHACKRPWPSLFFCSLFPENLLNTCKSPCPSFFFCSFLAENFLIPWKSKTLVY